MNIPTALTLSRLGAVPLLVALLLLRFPHHDEFAALAFLVFSFTDTLDGQIARRRSQVSELGKLLDPLTDKIFVLSVLTILVEEHLVAGWVVIVILSREFLVTVMRSVIATSGRVVAAAPSGKTKTVIQMITVTVLILQRPYPQLGVVAALLVVATLALTVWSGLEFVMRHRDELRDPAPGARRTEILVAEIATALAGGSVSTAESCTGGLVAKLLTDRPGSSAYFRGGVVVYSDAAKTAQLGVPAALIGAHGAVSGEVAQAMAVAVRLKFATDFGIGVTGIAGPGADGTMKPVGLTHVAVASADGVEVREFQFPGNRDENRLDAATEALAMLVTALQARARAGAS